MGKICCAATESLLQQLPASGLTNLECWRQRKHFAFTPRLCELSTLRSLLLLQPSYVTDSFLPFPTHDDSAYGQQEDVLAPLSALHLTRLQLPPVRRVQLRALQLPQLQQLQVKLWLGADGEQLQVSHLTALQRLTVTEGNNSCGMTGSDEFPGVLQELCWNECGQGHCTEQPLLGLSRLQKLRLHFGQQPPAAEQVEQLSTISSLREVSLAYVASPVPCIEAAAAAAWPALPLVGLRLSDMDLASAALLQQLQQLRGLTALTLEIKEKPEQAQVTFNEVAEMVQSLPALQRLSLQHLRFKATVEAKQSGRLGMYHDAAGVEALLQAVGGLRELNYAYVVSPLKLLKAAEQEVKGRLPQLVGNLMGRWCSVVVGSTVPKLPVAPMLRIDTREGRNHVMPF
jgi:hypothetical protein